MENPIDWLSFFVSLAALIVSIVAAVFSFKRMKTDRERLNQSIAAADKAARDALKLSQEADRNAKTAIDHVMANQESTIRKMLTYTSSEMTNAKRDLADFKMKNPNEDFSLREKILNSKVEAWFNVYELACNLYLTGKVDKERFEKNFRGEIENLLKIPKYTKRYFDPFKSKYENILSVYKEWNP